MGDRDRYLELIEQLHEFLSTNNLSSLELIDLIPELDAVRDRATAIKNRRLIAETKQILGI